MTIFDQINSILFTKKKIEMNCDDESQFSPFILNRWLSFYDPNIAFIVNETTNKLRSFYTKRELYDIYFHIYPKMRYKKINYIKKKKETEKTKKEELYIPEFCSVREYKYNVDLIKELDI